MNRPFLRDRRYLPHLENRGAPYFITLRLADSLPAKLLEQMRAELRMLKRDFAERNLNVLEHKRLKYLQTKKVQEYLDAGSGACWLAQPIIADLVKEAVQHHESVSYVTHACCIMPNHLHWILTPLRTSGMNKNDSRIISILQPFKSYTAHVANKALQRTGSFWAREYYDHLIRDDQQFDRLVRYTLENPVKANLCRHWNEWKWTICSEQMAKAFSDL